MSGVALSAGDPESFRTHLQRHRGDIEAIFMEAVRRRRDVRVAVQEAVEMTVAGMRAELEALRERVNRMEGQR